MLFNGVLMQPGDPIDPSKCQNLRVLLSTRYIRKVPDKQAPPPSPPSNTGEGDKVTGVKVSTPVDTPPVAPPKPPEDAPPASDDKVEGDKGDKDLVDDKTSEGISQESNKTPEEPVTPPVNTAVITEPVITPVVPNPNVPPVSQVPLKAPMTSAVPIKGTAPVPIKTPTQQQKPYTANLPKKE